MPNPLPKVKIIEYKDNDTFKVDLVDDKGKPLGKEFSVRLADMDAPEVAHGYWKDKKTGEEHKATPQQPGHLPIKEFESLVGKTVSFKKTGIDTKYGRTVGHLFNDKNESFTDIAKRNKQGADKIGEYEYALPEYEGSDKDSLISGKSFRAYHNIHTQNKNDPKEKAAGYNEIRRKFNFSGDARVDRFMDEQQVKIKNKSLNIYKLNQTPPIATPSNTTIPSKSSTTMSKPTYKDSSKSVQRISTEEGAKVFQSKDVVNEEEFLKSGIDPKDIVGFEKHTGAGGATYLYPLLKGESLKTWKNELQAGINAGNPETNIYGNNYATGKQEQTNWRNSFNSAINSGGKPVETKVEGKVKETPPPEEQSNITAEEFENDGQEYNSQSGNNIERGFNQDAVEYTTPQNLLKLLRSSNNAKEGSNYILSKDGKTVIGSRKGSDEIIRYKTNGTYIDREGQTGEFAVQGNTVDQEGKPITGTKVIRTNARGGFENFVNGTLKGNLLTRLSSKFVNLASGYPTDLTLSEQISAHQGNAKSTALSNPNRQYGTLGKLAKVTANAAQYIPLVGSLATSAEVGMDLHKENQNNDLTFGDAGRAAAAEIVGKAAGKLITKGGKYVPLKKPAWVKQFFDNQMKPSELKKREDDAVELAKKVKDFTDKRLKRKTDYNNELGKRDLSVNELKKKSIKIDSPKTGKLNFIKDVLLDEDDIIRGGWGKMQRRNAEKKALGKHLNSSKVKPSLIQSTPPPANTSQNPTPSANNQTSNAVNQAQQQTSSSIPPSKKTLKLQGKVSIKPKVSGKNYVPGTSGKNLKDEVQGLREFTQRGGDPVDGKKYEDFVNERIRDHNFIVNEIHKYEGLLSQLGNSKHNAFEKMRLTKIIKELNIKYKTYLKQGGTLKFQRGGGIPKFQSPYRPLPKDNDLLDYMKNNSNTYPSPTPLNTNTWSNSPFKPLPVKQVPLTYDYSKYDFTNPSTVKPHYTYLPVQQQLHDAGYNLGSTGPYKNGVDGVWGNKSRKALWKAFSGSTRIQDRPHIATATKTVDQVIDYGTAREETPVKDPKTSYQPDYNLIGLGVQGLGFLGRTKFTGEQSKYIKPNLIIPRPTGDPMWQQKLGAAAEQQYYGSKALSSDPTRNMIAGQLNNRLYSDNVNRANNENSAVWQSNTEKYNAAKNAEEQYNNQNINNVTNDNIRQNNAIKGANSAAMSKYIGDNLTNVNKYFAQKGTDQNQFNQYGLLAKSQMRQSNYNDLIGKHAVELDKAQQQLSEGIITAQQYNDIKVRQASDIDAQEKQFLTSLGIKRNGSVLYKKGGSIETVTYKREVAVDNLFIKTAHKYAELSHKASESALKKGHDTVMAAMKGVTSHKPFVIKK